MLVSSGHLSLATILEVLNLRTTGLVRLLQPVVLPVATGLPRTGLTLSISSTLERMLFCRQESSVGSCWSRTKSSFPRRGWWSTRKNSAPVPAQCVVHGGTATSVGTLGTSTVSIDDFLIQQQRIMINTAATALGE